MSNVPFTLSQSRIHHISLSAATVPPERYGGSELIVANLARGQVELGQRVLVYSPGECPIRGVTHIQTIPSPEVYKSGVDAIQPNTPEHIEAIRKNLSRYWQPGDVIHLHHFQQYGFLKDVLERKNVIETAHWVKTGTSPVIYPSFAVAGKINKPGIVVPHGIDLNLFSANSDESKVKDFLFYAGRITIDKGLGIASKAASSTNKELIIAGPEPNTEFGQSIIQRHRYIGELTPIELISYYSTASAVVYASDYTEPFGLTPVEAMACGCPIITTGLGGLGDTVVNEETGFIISNLQDFIMAIMRIDEIDRSACVKRAQLFSLDKMAKSSLDAYLTYYG